MVRYKRSNRANPGALQWGHPKRSGTGAFRTGFADNSYPDVKRVGFAISPRLVCAVNARNSRGEIAGRVWQPACAGRYVLTRKLWRVQFPAPTGAVRLFGCDERRRLAGARQWRRTPERMLPPGVEKGCSPPTSPLRPLSIAPAPLPSSLPLPQERGRGLFISMVQ